MRMFNADPCPHLRLGKKDLPATLIDLLNKAVAELDKNRACAKMLFAHASALLVAETETTGPEYAPPPSGGLSGWKIRYVKAFVDENIAEPITVTQLSRMANLSTAHFSRAFKNSLGVTPHHYLTGRRIALAQQMMLAEEVPIREVALACGFSDQAHFSNTFRRCIGKSPKVWRRENRQFDALIKALQSRSA